MREDADLHGFSEHHQRHVCTTFQYIDKLLSEAEHTMTDAGSQSPFGRHDADPALGNARLHSPHSRSDGARNGGTHYSSTGAALGRGLGGRD